MHIYILLVNDMAKKKVVQTELDGEEYDLLRKAVEKGV